MAAMTIMGPPKPRLGPPVVLGSEEIMAPKAHGNYHWPVQEKLRWNCEAALADEICNFNRRGAERKGYLMKTSFQKQAAAAKDFHFYDSNTGQLLFQLPSKSRTIEAFLKESIHHGWPSFRDNEVNWKQVRVLLDGEVVSKDGTHLGHNIPDYSGNRYCINLVCIAGTARPAATAGWRDFFRGQPAPETSPPAPIPGNHFVLTGSRLMPPFPDDLSVIYFGTGCYWGAEKAFWRLPGVYSTAVGYAGGHDFSVNPSYVYVCTGESGHAEVVQVVWDPARIALGDLLRQFWSCHDPTQGNAQGADKGTQYRSCIYCTTEEQSPVASASLRAFDKVLRESGYPPITTEVRIDCPFYYGEDTHQQFLAKRAPYGRHCSAEPTGVAVPPFQDWDWKDSRPSCAEPKLPDNFWASFDASIEAPDAQASLETSALAVAAEDLEKRRNSQAMLASKVESDLRLAVILRYCGRCGGYQRRAIELAGFLQRALEIKVGTVPDADRTGNFDVEVRQASGDLETVHCKRKGHGFVDSVEKVLGILLAVVAADEKVAAAAATAGDLTTNLASTAANFPGLQTKPAAAVALLKTASSSRKSVGFGSRELRPRVPPNSKTPQLLGREMSEAAPTEVEQAKPCLCWTPAVLTANPAVT